MADRKLEAGMPLVVLGIQVLLSEGGIRMTPDRAKIDKWCRIIRDALSRGAPVSPARNDVALFV